GRAERHPRGADRETVGRALHVAADEHAAVRRLERRAYAEFAVRTIRLLLHRPRRPHQRGAHAQTSFRNELPAASRATPKYSATVAPRSANVARSPRPRAAPAARAPTPARLPVNDRWTAWSDRCRGPP